MALAIVSSRTLKCVRSNDPLNAESMLRMEAERLVAPTAGTRLRFNAMPGIAYVVQYCDTLTGTPWFDLASVPAQTFSRASEIIDPHTANRPTRYYRVIIPKSR